MRFVWIFVFGLLHFIDVIIFFKENVGLGKVGNDKGCYCNYDLEVVD